MSIGQPDFLLLFDESGSATAVTNYGTAGSGYSIGQGTSGTDFSWSPNSGPYAADGGGAFNSLIAAGAALSYLSTAATAPPAALQDVNAMVAFSLSSFILGTGFLINENGGQIRVKAQTPAGGGDFDLLVEAYTSSAFTAGPITFSALAFGTDYILSAALNTQTSGTLALTAQLGSGSAQSASGSSGGTVLAGAWPLINCGDGFTTYYGFVGSLYAFAYQRGTDIAWDADDLASINADPTVIPGWPSGGGQKYSYTASGGFQVGGSSAQTRAAARAASGGATLGGAAALVRAAVHAASGGTQIGGTASVSFNHGTQSYTYVATGGFLVGGGSTSLRALSYRGAGGVLLGGTAALAFVRSEPLADGGMRLGGSAGYATHESVRTVIASGGMYVGGIAEVSFFSTTGTGRRIYWRSAPLIGRYTSIVPPALAVGEYLHRLSG